MAHPLAAPFVLLVLLLTGCRATLDQRGPAHGSEGHEGAESHEGPGSHSHEHPPRPPPLGADLRFAWGAAVEHAHESRRATPYVHAFHLEPAFLGRDLLVHAEREGDEHALEAELEYALTRRLLVVAEAPFHVTDEEDGIGDVGLGLRGLLVETNRLLLSAQLACELPTARGALGADEVVWAPSLLAWADLGCWVTAQAGATLAYASESRSSELTWGAALTKSFACSPLFGCASRAHPHGSVVSLLLEGRASYALSGPEDGASAHELLFGISVPATPGLDVRAGWSLRWDDEDDAAAGWVVGFALHL